MGLISRIRNYFRQRRSGEATVITHPVTYQGSKISVEIHDTNGFTEKELATFKVAIEILIEVVNSEEFKDRCLHPPRNLDHTNGKTYQEIYDNFISGETELEPIKDKDIDVYITMYYSRNRVIGYTYPTTLRTWINRKFFGDITTIVGNIVHEYMHKCGYTHEYSGYTQYNIPYYYGNVASYLTEKVMNGYELTPLKQISLD